MRPKTLLKVAALVVLLGVYWWASRRADRAQAELGEPSGALSTREMLFGMPPAENPNNQTFPLPPETPPPTPPPSRPAELPPPPPAAAVPSPDRIVLVEATTAHAGPGPQHESTMRLSAGEEFKRGEERDGWVQLEDAPVESWVPAGAVTAKQVTAAQLEAAEDVARKARATAALEALVPKRDDVAGTIAWHAAALKGKAVHLEAYIVRYPAGMDVLRLRVTMPVGRLDPTGMIVAVGEERHRFQGLHFTVVGPSQFGHFVGLDENALELNAQDMLRAVARSNGALLRLTGEGREETMEITPVECEAIAKVLAVYDGMSGL